jgi:fucose-1-phosphate guanylyltransferase
MAGAATEDGMEESARIGRYMRGLLERYEAVRGRSPAEVGEPFWDLVAISAGDAAQEASYRAQLHMKQEQGELPLVPFLCLADPPGPRVGSGGSTLHVLKELERQHPGKLDTWRVLLIHAGGFSKRLPSHSCAGKIFSPLPIRTAGGAPFQMLDLKLALYLPFLAAMEPGVFVTASDDIEVA